LGIVGYGDIGKRVAKIADAMGMKVIVYNRSKKEMPYTQVDKETLFKESDFISLHCPLNEETRYLVNKETLSYMKPTAVLINTARGPVINEYDLRYALDNNVIAHALVDVLSIEPMQKDCPLIGAKNITFTPHIAWAPRETRQRLIDKVANNIKAFIDNCPINVVNK
jgi:glycerate dehydrogenase